jgi:hypothetical protein
MRTLLNYLFSVSVPVTGDGAMQILPAGPASRAAGRLWGKLLLTCVLFLAPLLLLIIVDQLWLLVALVALALVFSVAVLFAILDLATFCGLPGLRIEEGALLIKKEGGRARRYPYDKVARIGQVSSNEKGSDLYHLEIVFSDGTEWRTNARGQSAIPVLTQFGDLISERSDRPISPTFAG